MGVLIWVSLVGFALHSARSIELELVRILHVLPIVGTLFILNNFLMSVYVRYLYLRKGLVLKVAEAFLLIFVSTSINFVVPFKVGLGYRALYLRRHHGFYVERFASTFVACNFLLLLASLVFLAISIIYIWSVSRRFDLFLSAVIFVLMIFSAMPFLLPTATLKKLGKLSGWLLRISTDTLDLIREPQLVAMAVSITMIFTLITALSLYFVFPVVQEEIAYGPLISLALSQTVTGLISLTPGGAGIQEAIGALFYDLLKIEWDKIVLALIILRLMKVSTVAVLGVPAYWMLEHTRLRSRRT